MPNAFGLESLFAPISIFDAKRTKKRSPDEASAMIAPMTVESAPVSVAATTTPWIGWADMTRRQSDLMSRMAVDSSGRPVMVGNSNSSIALSRHTPNATLDTSFDGDGKVFVGAPSGKQTVSALSGDVVIQPDGKVVVGGLLSTSSSPAGNQFFLARLNREREPRHLVRRRRQGRDADADGRRRVPGAAPSPSTPRTRARSRSSPRATTPRATSSIRRPIPPTGSSPATSRTASSTVHSAATASSRSTR